MAESELQGMETVRVPMVDPEIVRQLRALHALGWASVGTLPPQALRRTQATLATDAGATGLMVAQHLGHATGAAPAVTHRAYVERDAARDAAVQRGLRGRQRPAPDPGSVETTVETHPGEGAAAMAK